MLRKTTLCALATAGIAMGGCPLADDVGGGGTEGTGDDTTTTNMNPTVTATVPSQVDTSVGSMSGSTTVSSSEDSSTTENADVFVFDETPLDMYVQVDRVGFPAVNTGLNILGDKDVYNQASPADDAALTFLPNIAESLEVLHLGAPDAQVDNNTGLDDDLLALGYTPCVTPPLPMDNCDDQGAPFVVPDVVEINLAIDPGFPNGRRLEDPVMDVILAVLLLDLDVDPLTAFLDLDNDGELGPTLNPPANDVDFAAEFPYLAPAHEQ